MPLERFLEEFVAKRPGGARFRDWSVYASETGQVAVGTKDREAGNPHAPLKFSESFTARYVIVWDDERVSRGVLERHQLEHDLDEAARQARAAAYDDPDAAQVRGPAPVPDVPLRDDRVARAAGGELDPLVERLARVRDCVDRHRLRTWSGSFSAATTDAHLMTSAGLDAAGTGTIAGWGVTFDGEFGTGHRSRAFEPLDAFDARLDRLADLVRGLATNASPPDGGVLPVLLHPDVTEGFVLETLLHNLSGAVVSHGEGFFRKEQFGSDTPVLREDLTLRIDPLAPLRAGAYRFTTEGVPADRCVYIDRGRLVTPVLGLKYARRLGREPTPIPYAFDTIHLEASGAMTRSDAMTRASGGVLVLGVLGIHTQDMSSGDFSLSAPQSLRIEDGRTGGRVRLTISGNLFRALRSEKTALVRFEGEHTPGLLIHCRVDPK